ncbi:IPT/TIG domain-containing protein [Rubrivirga marina]|uniref:IPT/TIG domain-containing protein n=1 Tax=Rubrivirga marina TaxID=1196024 RepID=A0A271J4P2_9BACT|nr:IPT/TIG domain-containing protein [Rubrivirga marina]PAP78320.1 hypothetical protein BSZ37_18785 [Rubrivirga marina]
MLTPSTSWLRLAPLAGLVLLLAACDSGDGSSLYDPDAGTNPAPVISSVSPDGVVLAGVDVVVIEGQNFSDDPALNTVVFDDANGSAAPGEVLSATPTRLEVRVPNLPNPALRVRVAVIGAQDYSNAVALPLTPAFVSFGEISRTEVPYGIAADADGTLYLSLENEGASVGVIEIGPDGTRSPYFASTFPWAALARGGDQLFGVRRVRAVFELPEGGSQTVLAAFQPTSLLLAAVAATPDGAVYAGGNAPTLYRVSADGTASDTAFPANIRALAVVDGTLYAVGAGGTGAPDQLYTVPLAADGTPGTPQALAALPAVGTALAVAADGTVYVGLDRTTDPIVTVAPNGQVEVLYPGVLSGPINSLAYGAGTQLYAVREAADGEPADVLRVETRREGAR